VLCSSGFFIVVVLMHAAARSTLVARCLPQLVRSRDPQAILASGLRLRAPPPAKQPLQQRRCASTAPASDLGSTQYVEARGRQLFVVSRGEDSEAGPVICIPGAIGTAETDFAGQVLGLSTGRRVVSFDPAGYGKSRPPARNWTNFYHQDGEDAHAIMESLGYSTYTVVGWSDGANAATLLAARRPEAVRKLVLFGGNAWVEQEDIDLYEQTREVKKHWSKGMLAKHEPVYGDDLQPMWDGFCDAMKEIMAAGGDVSQDAAKSIRCPTFVLAGAKDPMAPLHHPTWLSKNIPGARLHVFPDGKHNIHIKYKDEFNQLVLDFLAE